MKREAGSEVKPSKIGLTQLYLYLSARTLRCAKGPRGVQRRLSAKRGNIGFLVSRRRKLSKETGTTFPSSPPRAVAQAQPPDYFERYSGLKALSALF